MGLGATDAPTQKCRVSNAVPGTLVALRWPSDAAVLALSSFMGEGGDASEVSRLRYQLWYHAKLPREDVRELLFLDGDWLLRQEEVPRNRYGLGLVVEVFWKGEIVPFAFRRVGDKFYLGDKNELSHRSVIKLVKKMRSMKRQLGAMGARLGTPIRRAKWMLPKKAILLQEQLGAGEFGVVYKAQRKRGFWKPKETVAVKTVSGGMTGAMAQEKFMAEARKMRQWQHPNVIALIGVVVQDPPWLVLEYAPSGSLRAFLRHPTNTAAITSARRRDWCVDTVMGMEYLHSKDVIHRDIAARNCLLGASPRYPAKISDFGLSRVAGPTCGYKSATEMKLPVRWMAPESFLSLTFSQKSDVWSWGILVWEIYSGGIEPYASISNADIQKRVAVEGYRLELPAHMAPEIAELVVAVWAHSPDSRPAFSQLARILHADASVALPDTSSYTDHSITLTAEIDEPDD